MRVACIVAKFPVISETFILAQITGLLERGHEVDIYALNGRPQATSRLQPEVEKYGLLDRTYYVPWMPANYFLRALKGLVLLFAKCCKDPLVWLRALNVFKYGKQATSLELLYRTIPLLGKGAYDIIHCQFGTVGIKAIELRNLGALRGKLVVSFRGSDISKYPRQHGNDVYNRLFAIGDLFLPNCDHFKRRLARLGCDEKKIVVHRSGINCAKFALTPRPPLPNGSVRIITIGRLVEKKALDYSIRAVAKLAERNLNIEYKIFGDGPLRGELQQLIEELRLARTTKLLGSKHQQEITEILNDAHIFMAPSMTAKDGDQDGPLNVLKEAMAMGLPVVSTYHAGIPELIEDGVSGLLVPEYDIDALVEKLSYLIEHPEIWSRMGRAGRAHVEKHWDSRKLNDALVSHYQRLLSASAAGTTSISEILDVPELVC